MKILKEETYSKLLNEIDKLKQAKQKLEESKSNLQNELKDLKQEYAQFATETKMNFTIRRFILGKKGSGKTTFIKSILPKINSYFIIDCTGEYDYVSESNRLFVDTKEKYDISNILERIEHNKDKLIIIDSPELLGSIDWFMLNSRKYNFIITSQAKGCVEKYIDGADFIYDFGTTDEFNNKPDKSKVMFFKRTDEISKNNGNYCVSTKGAIGAITGLAALSIVFLGLVAVARS